MELSATRDAAPRRRVAGRRLRSCWHPPRSQGPGGAHPRPAGRQYPAGGDLGFAVDQRVERQPNEDGRIECVQDRAVNPNYGIGVKRALPPAPGAGGHDLRDSEIRDQRLAVAEQSAVQVLALGLLEIELGQGTGVQVEAWWRRLAQAPGARGPALRASGRLPCPCPPRRGLHDPRSPLPRLAAKRLGACVGRPRSLVTAGSWRCPAAATWRPADRGR